MVAAFAVLTIAGCGGGGGSGDADQIRSTIEAATTTKDPNNCVERQTQRYTEQTEFAKGAEAIRSCEGSTTDVDANTVDVSAITVSGEKATADVAFHGAGFDGQSLQISLIKDDEQWKLDHIDRFTHFDKAKFLDEFEQAATKGAGEETSSAARCLTDALSKLPDQKLQQLFLSGDPAAFVGLITPCLGVSPSTSG